MDHRGQLALDHGFGVARIALSQGLAHAHDGRYSAGQQRLGLGGHQRITFAVVSTALRVPDQGIAAATFGKHGGRHLASKGTVFMRRDILRAPADIAGGQGGGSFEQERERHAHGDVRRKRPGCQDGSQQLGIGRPAAVHFPVTDDEGLSHEHLHQVRTILPTWTLDSMRA